MFCSLQLAKQTTIPNARSCTRLLTPSFSLYRFVVSRTSGAEYNRPLSSRTTRQTNARPAQAVTPCDAYLWLESRAQIINVSYRMDSAIAPSLRFSGTRRLVVCFARTTRRKRDGRRLQRETTSQAKTCPANRPTNYHHPACRQREPGRARRVQIETPKTERT